MLTALSLDDQFENIPTETNHHHGPNGSLFISHPPIISRAHPHRVVVEGVGVVTVWQPWHRVTADDDAVTDGEGLDGVGLVGVEGDDGHLTPALRPTAHPQVLDTKTRSVRG